MLRINHAIKFSKLYLHFLSMIFLFNFTVVIIFHLVFRCNFALMLLAELVLDQASVDWEEHLPLMLHVIFLGKSWRFYRTPCTLSFSRWQVYRTSLSVLVNSLHPSICMYLLHTFFYTFPKEVTRRICLIIKSFFRW